MGVICYAGDTIEDDRRTPISETEQFLELVDIDVESRTLASLRNSLE